MKFILYRDGKKEWRWRLVARNGRIIAVSGEGYINQSDAVKICKKLRPDYAILGIETP